MKIGILTYHRSENYGALLQAVALRHVLEDTGHETYFIDYFPDYHARLYRPFSFHMCRQYNVKGQVAYLLEYPLRKMRHQVFQEFIRKEILPYCKQMDEAYDVVFYGSDQIWRKQSALNDFNPIYFGANNIQSKVHASYAASMGTHDLSDEEKRRIKELTGHLDFVSVREYSLKKLLGGLGVEGVGLDLDPTLLRTQSEWNRDMPFSLSSKKSYVLVYDLQTGCFDERAVRAFAKDRNVDIINLTGTARKIPTYHLRSVSGPCEFINLIRGADCVLTSSYHGLVFSVIYEKQFFASFKYNAGRAESILSNLGLSNRILPVCASRIPAPHDIDYVPVKSQIAKARSKSLSYIGEVLESVGR